MIIIVAHFACGGEMFSYHNYKMGIEIVLADAPCLAFILFAVLKKNLPALTSGVLFTATHTYFAVVNFVNK